MTGPSAAPNRTSRYASPADFALNLTIIIRAAGRAAPGAGTVTSRRAGSDATTWSTPASSMCCRFNRTRVSG